MAADKTKSSFKLLGTTSGSYPDQQLLSAQVHNGNDHHRAQIAVEGNELVVSTLQQGEGYTETRIPLPEW